MHGRQIFFLLCFFLLFSFRLSEMIQSNSLDRELSKLKFSETEEDSGKQNKKTTQHETKEAVPTSNSKVRIQKFDNFGIMYRK